MCSAVSAIMQLAVLLIIAGCTSGFGSVLLKKSLAKRNAVDSEKHIYHIPTGLKDGYQVNVTGQLATAKERITFSLMTEDKNNNAPDWNNVACEVQFNFLTNSDNGSIMIVTVLNGSATLIDEGLAATVTLNDNFFVGFTVQHEHNIEVNFGESSSASGCDLKHKLEEISYLIITGSVGKVAELHFKLG